VGGACCSCNSGVGVVHGGAILGQCSAAPSSAVIHAASIFILVIHVEHAALAVIITLVAVAVIVAVARQIGGIRSCRRCSPLW